MDRPPALLPPEEEIERDGSELTGEGPEKTRSGMGSNPPVSPGGRSSGSGESAQEPSELPDPRTISGPVPSETRATTGATSP